MARNRAARYWLCTVWAIATLAAGVAAQGGGKPAKGNPTPGTPQPDAPNLADRVTVSGCVQAAPGRSESGVDPNTPTGTRFLLTRTERENVNPPGTGGSNAAASVSGRIARLEGIERLLSPFVGTKVEVSGEVKLRAAGSRGEGVGSNVATIQVEFIRKLAGSCS